MKKKIASICMVLFLLSSMMTSFATDRTDTYFKQRVYKEGVEHEDVKHIQNALVAGGYLTLDELTSTYDEQTAEAIKKFQSEHGLDDDGIAGAKTLEAMFELGYMNELDTIILKPGEKNESVQILQECLVDMGYLQIDETTEYYGEQTKAAVKAYQADAGLTADGIAGTLTLHEMEEAGYLFLNRLQMESEPEVVDNYGKITKYMFTPGDRDQEVAIVQKILVEEGLLDIDEYSDYYGPETEAAVKAFQEKYNLKADGVAGTETIAKMIQLGYVNQVQVVSRNSSERRFGEYIEWTDMMAMIDKGHTVFLLEDFYTGTTFQVLAAYGGVHSDVEPLTANDAHIIKQLWGGEYSWVRRPILVHFNGHVYAASLNGMPHAGREDMPEGQYVNDRSGGYGYGYNFDSVKGNDFNGHLCLHFKNSKLHSNRKTDDKHQKNVRIAAGLEQ